MFARARRARFSHLYFDARRPESKGESRSARDPKRKSSFTQTRTSPPKSDVKLATLHPSFATTVVRDAASKRARGAAHRHAHRRIQALRQTHNTHN